MWALWLKYLRILISGMVLDLPPHSTLYLLMCQPHCSTAAIRSNLFTRCTRAKYAIQMPIQTMWRRIRHWFFPPPCRLVTNSMTSSGTQSTTFQWWMCRNWWGSDRGMYPLMSLLLLCSCIHLSQRATRSIFRSGGKWTKFGTWCRR